MSEVLSEPNPYMGPRPFEREDEALFHGRDREARELLALVLANRLVVLCAASGAGKTSLLNARLVPLLEHEEDFDVLPIVRLRSPEDTAPPSAPNAYVFSLLTNLVRAAGDLQQTSDATATSSPRERRAAARASAKLMQADPDVQRKLLTASVSDFLAERGGRHDEFGQPVPRALVIDQFEELFTVFPEHWTRRARFVEQLTEALDGDPLLRVLLAIREDYLAQLGSLVKSSAERSTAQFRLERLGPEAALVAVQKPLEGRTRSYAKGVPKKLVDDLLKFRVDTGRGESVEVTGEFVEPVQLQVVCQSLWSQLPPDVTEITEDHMRAFGDVNQALSRFYAEAAKAAADDAHISEKEVRQWIEDHFITSAGTRGFVYRGGSVSAGMANEVIDVLEDKHLIRAEWRAGARWYELTHDRFITPIRVSNREYFESLLAARSEVDERAVRAYESMQTGHAHLVAGEYALALDASEQALAIYEQLDDPWGAADALETIAFARYALGELEPALLYFRRALELLAALDDPSGHSTTRAWQAAVLQNVGAVQLQLGDSKQGLDAYQRALRLYRETGDAAAMATVLAVIADLHRAGNAPEAALKAYEEAMAQYVSVRDTESQQQMLLEIGDLYHELEEYGKAVECADEALELDAASVRALYQRAAAHWYEGDYSAAVDDFTEVLELEPGWDLAYSGRGQALAEAGEFEPAVADLDLAIELAGSDVASRAYAHSGRGLAYGGLGRFRQALKEFEVSLKAQPGNAWAYFNRAVTYERMGKAAEAIADFQQALESSEPPLNRIKRDHALAKVSKA